MSEELWFNSQLELRDFPLSSIQKSNGPTYPPSQWVPRAVKWPGCEADHSYLCSVDNKHVWSYISTHIFPNVMVLI
jgi:hypothetical protein